MWLYQSAYERIPPTHAEFRRHSENNDDASKINHNTPIHYNSNKKISKPMCLLLTDCIEPMYTDNGPLENTTEHFVHEKKKGFNYYTLLGELM